MKKNLAMRGGARRPPASSRAVLMALLLPDPCDAHKYPSGYGGGE